MTMVSDAAGMMIAGFGVVVEITPYSSQEPEDSDNPVFFEESSTQESSFEKKVRLYTSRSAELLEEYGFDSDGDAIIYIDEDVIDVGDEISYSDMDYIVRDTRTNQIDEEQGQYLWVHELVEK